MKVNGVKVLVQQDSEVLLNLQCCRQTHKNEFGIRKKPGDVGPDSEVLWAQKIELERHASRVSQSPSP